MFCHRCGMNNREGSQFCSGCAAPMFAGQQPHFNQGFAGQQAQFNQGFAAQPQMSSGASGQAITSLMLGIVGLFFCSLFTTIPGMILGKMEMNAIKEGRASQSSLSLARAGFYVSLVGTVFYSIILAIYILMGVAAALSA